jgi:hypothetical protein
MELILKLVSDIHQKTKTLLLRVTVTQEMLLTQTSHSVLTIQRDPTVTQVMLLTQTSHSVLTIQTEAPHSDSDSDTGDVTDTNFSVLTIQTEAPHINIDSYPLSIFMLFFFEITQLLVEDKHIITGTWTHWTKDCLHCLIWLFKKCVGFCNYFADEAWSEGHKDYWSKLDQYFMALYSNTETDCIVRSDF